jgi:A/G-specific adenine glycosylase
MLQQTRVAAVIEHYHEFLRRFPTLKKLAAAREASVLAAWSGLGYYRRARMMHQAAKEIVSKHAGNFPESAAALRELPGIGRYTGAAIASIAFDEPIAVVDGNVERVLSRVLGKNLAHAEVWPIAEEVLDRKRPGDCNQAMMELGATVCGPRQPKCLVCPVSLVCKTRGELPGLEKSKPQQKREVHYVLDCRKDAVLLVERAKSESLMPGMWELPRIEGNGVDGSWLKLRHSITVTDYTVRVKQGPAGVKGRWIHKDQVLRFPLTGLARKILRRAGVI